MNTNLATPATITVECDYCGTGGRVVRHVGEYSHQGRFNQGPIYAVVCPADQLTGYYTLEAAVPA